MRGAATSSSRCWADLAWQQAQWDIFQPPLKGSNSDDAPGRTSRQSLCRLTTDRSRMKFAFSVRQSLSVQLYRTSSGVIWDLSAGSSSGRGFGLWPDKTKTTGNNNTLLPYFPIYSKCGLIVYPMLYIYRTRMANSALKCQIIYFN